MALRDINLVPENVLQRRYGVRHAIGWCLAYGLLIVLLLSGYFAYTHRVVTKRRVPTSESEVRKRLAATIADIEVRKQDIERLAFVRHISQPFGTAEILGRLAQIMDPKTWLTTCSVSAGEGGAPLLVMQGLAFSNARLGATMRALAEDDHFEDLVLKNSSEVKMSLDMPGVPENIIQFHIEATVVTE